MKNKDLIVFQLPDYADDEIHEKFIGAVAKENFIKENYNVLVVSNCKVNVYPFGASVFKLIILRLKSWLSTAKITKLK